MLEYKFNSQVPRFVTADIIYSECVRVRVIVHAAVGHNATISQREQTAENRRRFMLSLSGFSLRTRIKKTTDIPPKGRKRILKNSYLN